MFQHLLDVQVIFYFNPGRKHGDFNVSFIELGFLLDMVQSHGAPDGSGVGLEDLLSGPQC